MKKATKGPSNKTVQALLAKHECPVPFHEVRTRFLGNIATPAISAAPLQIIKDLWGGELPAFDSIDAVNELLDALVQGLWNDLTRHQKRSQPFRLTRMALEPTAEDLGRYGLVRLQNWTDSSKDFSTGRISSICPSGRTRPLGTLRRCAP